MYARISMGALAYNKLAKEVKHGPGVTPNPDKTTGPGVGLKGNAADNSPSPIPRKR